MKSMFGFNWDLKSGVQDPGNQMWNPNGVNVNRNGVTLTLQKDTSGKYLSTQITQLDPMGYGLHTVFLQGSRLDMFDPNVCFAVWLYDDKSSDHKEYDFEWCKWGDPNSTAPVKLGRVVPPEAYCEGAVSFEDHKIMLYHGPESVVIQAWGWHPVDQKWVNYAFHEFDDKVSVGATLRIALWLPAQPMFNGVSRGLTQVKITGVWFEADQ